MSDLGVELYKKFIDMMVAATSSLKAKEIRTKNDFDQTDEEDPSYEENMFIHSLSPSHRKTLAAMLDFDYDGGVFSALSRIDEARHEFGLQISLNGVEMANDPFGNTMFDDFALRSDGKPWPDDNA